MPDRRTTIIGLVESAIDRKLGSKLDHEAFCLLEEAEALAWQTPVIEPWTWICSYRLAHLQLRFAQTDSDLAAVGTRLTRTTGDAVLGEIRLPSLLMRVAVLHRLDPGGKDAALQAEQARAYRAAIECLTRTDPPQSGVAQTYSGQLQENWQNVIEFAGYFTGLDTRYAANAGHGLSILPHLGDDHWYMVGTHNLGINMSQPKSVAIADLQALVDARRVDIALVADERGGTMLLPQLPPRVRGQAATGLARAHFHVMAMASVTASQHRWEKACATSTTYNAASQIKARLQTLLPAATLKGLTGPIFGSPRQDKVHQFAPELRVAAVINAKLRQQLT